MALSLAYPNAARLHLSAPFASRRHVALPRHLAGISSAHGRRLLVVLAVQPSGLDDTEPSQGDKKVMSFDAAPKLPSLSLSMAPTWARWILGSIFLALPLYKRFLRLEDEVAKTASAVIEVVEDVAEEAEKISSEVADALPENSSLKQAAEAVEHTAEEVIKDAEFAEAIIEKVDDMVEDVDEVVESILEGRLKVNKNQKEEETGPSVELKNS